MYLQKDPPLFAARDDADILRLVDEHPLAWVVTAAAPGNSATPLPLLSDLDESGRLVALTGHFSVQNPQVQELRQDARAVILFSGPHGYISPAHTSQPRWAPTWNYAVARFEVRVEFRPAETRSALERLVARMERDRAQPWSLQQLGDRYEKMAQRIIAFRAHIDAQRASFKLGQDESRSTFDEIVGHLQDPLLVGWMREFNASA
jgi:transcriptional regulator